MKDVKALFVSEQGKSLTRKEVYIKNGDKKASCERDATKAQGYEKVKDASEVVTPRFLCTGGVDPYADPNTCKGEVALWLCCKSTGPASFPYSFSLLQEIPGALSLFTREAASFK